jgi:hypothetical protein
MAVMEIDPLEAVIKLAIADTALNTATGGRIDNRHHYGQDAGDWALTASSLIIFPAAGLPQLDLPVQAGQYLANCYGDTYFEAGKVFKKLQDFCRHNERRTVTTLAGKALVYFVILRGQPRQFLDEEARPNGGMPAYQVILEAQVAEEIVT